MDRDKQVEKYLSCEKAQVILVPGDVFHVPQFLVHSMEGLEDTEMFEFSTQHFEEDSYRIIKGN